MKLDEGQDMDVKNNFPAKSVESGLYVQLCCTILKVLPRKAAKGPPTSRISTSYQGFVCLIHGLRGLDSGHTAWLHLTARSITLPPSVEGEEKTAYRTKRQDYRMVFCMGR